MNGRLLLDESDLNSFCLINVVLFFNGYGRQVIYSTVKQRRGRSHVVHFVLYTEWHSIQPLDVGAYSLAKRISQKILFTDVILGERIETYGKDSPCSWMNCLQKWSSTRLSNEWVCYGWTSPFEQIGHFRIQNCPLQDSVTSGRS